MHKKITKSKSQLFKTNQECFHQILQPDNMADNILDKLHHQQQLEEWLQHQHEHQYQPQHPQRRRASNVNGKVYGESQK
ncbi:DNA polymerase epsilon subunit C [Pyrus ussuriensis x Pyrus communis]|uniref:DNA polymerase epsilon subunit C n=1 Tax=Pyrus ussuriensis x Pyrus communis TaxID=2448454 RepID=A0A5N5HUH0_9ROSA|nr:DNA polymerase epsilon subunit C [Pyrus ussuriensis x Pyrus communis]